jgi:hypothetical protein
MIPTVLWFVPLLRYLPFRRRTIMRGGEPYLTRIYLTPSTGRLGSWWRARYRGLFLHCFHTSDPDGLHNHPWHDARSLILRGAYFEERNFAPIESVADLLPLNGPHYSCMVTKRIYWPGNVNTITDRDWHRVELLSDEVWTLFSAGTKHGKGWGFSNGRRGASDEA